jgi:hypothetical protein
VKKCHDHYKVVEGRAGDEDSVDRIEDFIE